MNAVYSSNFFRIATRTAHSKNIFIDLLIFFIETVFNNSLVCSGNAADIASCPRNIVRTSAIFYNTIFKICTCNAPYIIFSVNFYNTTAINYFSFIFSGNAAYIISFRCIRSILIIRNRKLPYHSKIFNRSFIMGKQSHAVSDIAFAITLIVAKTHNRMSISIKIS